MVVTAWQSKSLAQPVNYPNSKTLQASIAQLSSLPPLVTAQEIHRLRASLRSVALGESFLLQGGDCAELFSYCEPAIIDSKIKLLLQMSLVLISSLNKPVVRIARMAGQYAKPRSSPTEKTPDGREIPSFRGDILNGFDEDQRELDPSRIVQAYFHSAATLNHIRSRLAAGIADLHNPFQWDLGHVRDTQLQTRYQSHVDRITDSLRFLKTVGADTAGPLQTVDLYTSHEGLLLEYEQALTRRIPNPNSSAEQSYYDTSAHFLWIGDRTRQIAGAHVDFFRGLENPIGVKIGPSMSSDELVQLLSILDPNHEPGKVTLITRYGATKIAEKLPEHILAVQGTRHVPVWQCDPMHGNTHTTPDGTKTRAFEAILSEVATAIQIHRECNSVLGGVHLELTGDAVTECIGGSEGIEEGDLKRRYTSYCDPRLNEKQALELAFLIAGEYGRTTGEMGR
ncbi:MAG: hypothetical protein Q9162_001957 [Coniocarpon cinnabarinum]